eukprot:3491045-Prymnesium_polylepis.1
MGVARRVIQRRVWASWDTVTPTATPVVASSRRPRAHSALPLARGATAHGHGPSRAQGAAKRLLTLAALRIGSNPICNKAGNGKTETETQTARNAKPRQAFVTVSQRSRHSRTSLSHARHGAAWSLR